MTNAELEDRRFGERNERSWQAQWEEGQADREAAQPDDLVGLMHDPYKRGKLADLWHQFITEAGWNYEDDLFRYVMLGEIFEPVRRQMEKDFMAYFEEARESGAI